MMRWVAVAGLLLGLLGFAPSGLPDAGAQSQGTPRQVPIVDPSDWNALIIRPGGARQKATIRLRYGVIYPGVTNVAAGSWALDAEKRLHIEFKGHPIIPVGAAVLEKQVPGRWAGILTEPNGQAQIEMRRIEEKRR